MLVMEKIGTVSGQQGRREIFTVSFVRCTYLFLHIGPYFPVLPSWQKVLHVCKKADPSELLTFLSAVLKTLFSLYSRI